MTRVANSSGSVDDVGMMSAAVVARLRQLITNSRMLPHRNPLGTRNGGGMAAVDDDAEPVSIVPSAASVASSGMCGVSSFAIAAAMFSITDGVIASVTLRCRILRFPTASIHSWSSDKIGMPRRTATAVNALCEQYGTMHISSGTACGQDFDAQSVTYVHTKLVHVFTSTYNDHKSSVKGVKIISTRTIIQFYTLRYRSQSVKNRVICVRIAAVYSSVDGSQRADAVYDWCQSLYDALDIVFFSEYAVEIHIHCLAFVNPKMLAAEFKEFPVTERIVQLTFDVGRSKNGFLKNPCAVSNKGHEVFVSQYHIM